MSLQREQLGKIILQYTESQYLQSVQLLKECLSFGVLQLKQKNESE